MIAITEKAAKKILQSKEEDSAEENSFLRVRVEKGGCSGLTYKLEFDTQKKDTDKVFQEFGAQVVVDMTSFLHVLGMTLDYEGGLNGNGFVFVNPNATKVCSCGASFAT